MKLNPKDVHKFFCNMKTGLGYDIHRLTLGRKLILGGVTIPYSKGLLGHSDGDVLLHAVCDALLGAMGKGDIGEHFPDADPVNKGISSIKILKYTAQMLRKENFELVNIDNIIFAQEPKLLKYKPKMCSIIAKALDVVESRINIKAKTTEGLGVIGRKEAMAAMCVAVITKWQSNMDKWPINLIV